MNMDVFKVPRLFTGHWWRRRVSSLYRGGEERDREREESFRLIRYIALLWFMPCINQTDLFPVTHPLNQSRNTKQLYTHYTASSPSATVTIRVPCPAVPPGRNNHIHWLKCSKCDMCCLVKLYTDKWVTHHHYIVLQLQYYCSFPFVY